jgi:hypothetical protein
MAPLNTEETLHLRRYFERISRNKARQFAEQNSIPQGEVMNDTHSPWEADLHELSGQQIRPFRKR